MIHRVINGKWRASRRSSRQPFIAVEAVHKQGSSNWSELFKQILLSFEGYGYNQGSLKSPDSQEPAIKYMQSKEKGSSVGNPYWIHIRLTRT